MGYANEIQKYYSTTPVKFLYASESADYKRINNAVVGKLYNNIGDKFRWVGLGNYILQVTGQEISHFNGVITKAFDLKKGRLSWLVNGGISSRQPSFWYEHWGGNNFKWNINLSKELRVDLGSSISIRTEKLRSNSIMQYR